MSSLAQLKAASVYAESPLSYAVNSTIDIDLWFDVEDRLKATEHVDMTTVSRLSFDESMFSVLPTMTIELRDDGTYYNLKPMQIGRKIYCRIQSSAKTNSNKEVEPLLTRMTIETVETTVEQSSGATKLVVECIYDCQGMVNSIPVYPPPGQTSISIVPENSSDTITKVCGLAGMACDSDLTDSMDYMLYVNNTLTTKELIDKVVDHAWIGEDDSPLFYVDLEGTGHYTSICRLVSTKDRMNVIGTVQFNRQLQRTDAEEYYSTFLEPGAVLIYQELKQVNLGARITNSGGGISRASMYDGIGTTRAALTGLSERASFPDIRNTGLSEQPDTNYVAYDGMSERLWLGTISNRDPSQVSKRNRTVVCGLASTNVHPFYEAALVNNRAVKLSFFQNFWKLTMDMNKQPSYFYTNPSLFPRIGKLIHVDFSDEDYANKVHTGDYLVTRVQHVWTPGNSYAVALTIVAGGYYPSNT